MIVTDATFEQEVLRWGQPVLVDFWASWCPPCKMTEPVTDRLGKAWEGRVKVAKLNVDQNPVTAAACNVAGVPTFVAFCQGKEVERRVGALSEQMLAAMIERMLSSQ